MTQERYQVAEYRAEVDIGEVAVELDLDGRKDPVALVFNSDQAIKDFIHVLKLSRLRAWRPELADKVTTKNCNRERR